MAASLSNLVTGGAGFIGAHLTRRLLARGEQVCLLDNFTRGNLDNLGAERSHPGLRVVEADVTDVARLRTVLYEQNVRRVYHLAAVHYIPYCLEHPTETVRTNVHGTQAVLEAIRGSEVQAFLFTSTSDVYAPKDGPFLESDPLEPLDIHGLSKLMAERLIAHAARAEAGRTFVVARLFNPYGPRETNPHLLPHVLSELRRGNAVRLGNTHPRRDFIHVDDVVGALLALVEQPAPFEIANVGVGATASVAEVLDLLGELTGQRLAIVKDATRVRSVDHDVLWADISRITTVTAWRPTISLRDGLRRLLEAEGLLRRAHAG